VPRGEAPWATNVANVGARSRYAYLEGGGVDFGARPQVETFPLGSPLAQNGDGLAARVIVSPVQGKHADLSQIGVRVIGPVHQLREDGDHVSLGRFAGRRQRNDGDHPPTGEARHLVMQPLGRTLSGGRHLGAGALPEIAEQPRAIVARQHRE
jgi:hypothetical protein